MIELVKIEGVIADFCSEIISEPLCFFSEADLQSLLFSKLLNHFPEMPETSIPRGPNSKGKYRTGIIHREYGYGKRRRMDIGIFSHDDICCIDSPNLQIGKIRKKYLKPRFGIELGTEKTPDSENHLKKDIKKLRNVSERGYLIYFFRDVTSADIGTATRNKTESKIKRIFRAPLESIDIPANIKVLCFVLRLRRRHKKIYGKCEVFDPQKKVWKKVNLQRTKEHILTILKK